MKNPIHFTISMGCYLPNTEVIQNKLKQLGLGLIAINPVIDSKVNNQYNSITFKYGLSFKEMQETKELVLARSKPILTEKQSLFLLDILYVCSDMQTFKEAMQEFINSNP